MKTEQKIGFIGLGNMGYHMATNIFNKGYSLVLYDIKKEILKSFESENTTIADSPQEVANEADVVLVSLPTPEVVKSVALGKDGLMEGKRMHTYIDLSTSGEITSKEVGETFREKGMEVLDSPVSGGVSGAEKGTLSLMVAGNKNSFDENYTLLSAVGRKVMHVGENVGQAQIMKVINNLLSSSALAITSEAMVLGVKAGLDPETMIDVLNASSGRNSATEDKFKTSILNRNFDYGFATALAYKDMKLCLELAEHHDVPMYLGTNVTHFWRYAMTQGAGNDDYTTIIKYFEEWAGIEVRERKENI